MSPTKNCSLVYLLLLVSFSAISQSSLELCISTPEGASINGLEGLGDFVDDCYAVEIDS